MDAVASATAPGFASATATMQAISQSATGPATALADFTNSGTVDLNVSAFASGSSAVADAELDYGLYQFASATSATATATNSGDIVATVNAQAIAATGDAFASATAFALVSQSVEAPGGAAVANFDNSGTIDLSVVALATGAEDATASASGSVVLQQAFNTPSATTLIDNSGSITAVASAVASGGGTGLTDTASAYAYLAGLGQNLTGTATSTATINNSGSVTLTALASAAGDEFANATATVTGIFQNMDGPGAKLVVVDNSGSFSAAATAIASAASGSAYAVAIGDDIDFDDNTGGEIAFDNSGDFLASAVASAPGTASAFAVAISAQANGTAPAVLTGTIDNSGSITAIASAAGGTYTTVVGVGTTATTLVGALSNATATGIYLELAGNTMTVTNSGSINVDAITANGDSVTDPLSPGGYATANGIVVTNNGTSNGGASLFTLNNSGDIIVRVSGDGGATWHRGMAVDVASAPNNSVLNLLGGGNIYGNIDVQSGDVINVDNGETSFDGIVNPECMPPVFDGAASSCGQGTMNITADGALFLRDRRITGPANTYDGPSYVFVDTYNQAAGGTIIYELQPAAGGTQPIGSYPQIFANTANIDGNLVARITTPNGLFADSYFWNNVIDANTLNGTFDSCALDGAYGNSPLLGLACTYDATENVDLGLTRTPFDGVAGLTDNEEAVAAAIENVYGVGLTGPFGNLVAELFTLDLGDLLDAYDQMSGVEYPNYLHAVRNNSFVQNTFVNDQLDCAIDLRGIAACAEPTYEGRVWILGDYNWGKLDSNSNAIGYKANDWAGTIGGEYRMGHFTLGAFAGYRHLDVDFPDALVGSKIKGKGWQLGLTAAYDVGTWYVRGIGSYSSLDGNSERDISIGTISGSAVGDPDVNVWSFYGEGGYRFNVSETSWVTPYLAVDYTSMKLKSFTESGGTGADLDFDSQTESQFSGVLGVKWTGNYNGIIPEAKVAYRYNFGGDIGVDASFADAPAGADFTKKEDRKSGSFMAGLSLAGALGSNVSGRIGYLGQFNSDYKDHAVYGSLTLAFGAPPSAAAAARRLRRLLRRRRPARTAR